MLYRKKSIDADKAYSEFVSNLSSQLPNEKRDSVLDILNREEARESFRMLYEHNVPERERNEIMRESLVDFSKGRSVHSGTFAYTMAMHLKQHHTYDNLVDELHDKGILSDNDYQRIKKDIKKSVEFHSKKLSGGLEKLLRKAAIILSFSLGSVLLLGSSFTVTGAVVGTSISYSMNIFIGLIALVIGLILLRREES